MSSTIMATTPDRVDQLDQLANAGIQAIDSDLPKLMDPSGMSSLIVTRELVERALKNTAIMTDAMMQDKVDELCRQLGLQINHIVEALKAGREEFGKAKSLSLMQIDPDDLGKYLEGDTSVARSVPNPFCDRTQQFARGMELLQSVAQHLGQSSAIGMIIKNLLGSDSAVADYCR